MNVAQAIGWLEGLDPGAELAVTARFPELGGWEVTSWAVVPGEAEGSPALEIEVFGSSFDYPGPSLELLEALPELLGRLEGARSLGQI